jgi:type II secretory pathway pseudopilin PulG
MINLIVIVISAVMCALVLVWWSRSSFRASIEAPKYFMLRQERRFDDGPRTPSSTYLL